MKKLVFSLFAAVLTVVPGTIALVTPLQASAAITADTLVKGTEPAVYWVANNSKRYAFPNIKTFWSWFSSDKLNDVQTLSATDLASLPLGGNVTYRPGAKLIKVTTDPKVYAVSRFGILHWVSTESLASALYGANWQNQVEDVPDVFFTNYTIGSPITHTWDYNVGSEWTTAQTPTQSLFGSLTTDALTLTLGKYDVTRGETVPLTAKLTSSAQVSNIRISLLDSNNTVLKTCDGVTTCSATVALPSTVMTQDYIATVSYIGAYGANTITSSPATLRLYVPNMTLRGSTDLSADVVAPSNTLPQVRVVASAIGMTTNDPYLTVRIYNQDNSLLKTCAGTATCEFTQSFPDLTQATDKTYTAIVSDNLGQSLPAVKTTVNVLPNTWYPSFNAWTFTAADYGVKTSMTTDLETQATGITLDSTDIRYQDTKIDPSDESFTVPSGSNISIAARVSPIASTDRLTVEIREDNTVYQTCTGTGSTSCAATVKISDTFKNHSFSVRATDQNGRTRTFRIPTAVYAGGGQTYTGNVRLLVDKTTVKRGDLLNLATKLTGTSSPISKLTTRIYNLETGTLVAICTWTTDCKTKTIVDTLPMTLNYYAVVVDTDGHETHASFAQSPVVVTQ